MTRLVGSAMWNRTSGAPAYVSNLVGDYGTTDNAPAIQAALNSSASIVYLPPGMFGCSQITVPRGKRLIGTGWGTADTLAAPSTMIGTGLCTANGGSYATNALVVVGSTNYGGSLESLAVFPTGAKNSGSTKAQVGVMSAGTKTRLWRVLVIGGVTPIYGPSLKQSGVSSQGTVAIDCISRSGPLLAVITTTVTGTYTATTGATVIKVASVSHLAVGMFMCNRNSYTQTPVQVVAIGVTTTPLKIKLAYKTKPSNGNTVDFLSGHTILLTADCRLISFHTPQGGMVDSGGDLQCTSGHHSDINTGGLYVGFKAYGLYHRGQAKHTNCVFDGKTIATTAMIFRVGGSLQISGGLAENGGIATTTTGTATVPFILDAGHDTTHGASVSNLTVGKKPHRKFTTLIKYTGGTAIARPDAFIGVTMEPTSMVLNATGTTLPSQWEGSPHPVSLLGNRYGATLLAQTVTPVAPIAGSLATPITMTAGTSYTVLTMTLAVGTWIVEAGVLIEAAAVSSPINCTARVTGGTATYTATGKTSDQRYSGSVATQTDEVVTLTLFAKVVVTVAGTVTIKATCHTHNAIAKAKTAISTIAGATGYTASAA